MANWEAYEKHIFEKLYNDFPDSVITKNDRILGQFSNARRQVDISIRGKLAGHDVLGVVECKFFNKRVNVKVIDGFIGFLEDVKANLGIIVTNKGFSTAAQNRARVKDIRLEVVEFQRLNQYKFSFDFDICEMCDPGPDRPLQPIYWGELIGESFELGRCSWCNGINLKCQICGCITPVYEFEYDQVMECLGACGSKFIVRNIRGMAYLENG